VRRRNPSLGARPSLLEPHHLHVAVKRHIGGPTAGWRWIVERLFAHLMRIRRLARDYERRTTSAEAMIYCSGRLTPEMLRTVLRHRSLPESGPSRERGENALVVH
jgi:hypothetical protein